MSPTSKLKEQRDRKISLFNPDFRIENMVFKPRNGQEDDPDFSIVQKKFIKEVHFFESVVKEKTVDYKGSSFGLNDLCWTAFVRGKCVTQSPMNYWQGEVDRLNRDENLQDTINCIQTTDASQNIACMDENQIPVQTKAVFGGIERTRVTTGCKGEEFGPCDQTTVSAKVMSVSYLLRDEVSVTEIAAQWEEEVLIKTIEEFNEDNGKGFMKKYFPEEEEKELELHINYMAQRTVNDELAQETKQNYLIVIISYIIMFIYISLSLGKFYHCVKSNILLSLMGIIMISCAVFISYCICGFAGIKSSLISLEVIPFLILAIGVDNMFLIYHSIYNVPTTDIEVKVGVGLRNIGTSITLSAFTQILTFFIGFYIEIPALKTFCITAVFALTANYIFQMSTYPAMLAIDLARKRAGYCDLLPFLKLNSPVNIKRMEKGIFTNFFKKYWYPVVTSKVCKFIVFVICLALFGLFFLAIYKIPLGLDQQLATLKDGNLYNYFGDIKKYVELSSMASIIIERANYKDARTFQALDALVELLSKRKTLIAPPLQMWYKGVQNLRDGVFIPAIKEACYKGVDPFEISGNFDKLTNYFLSIGLDHPCCKQFGLCGGQYYQDITFKYVV